MKSSAKELFFSFLGSKYQMMREGVIERYLSYSVSKEEEMTCMKNAVLRSCQKVSSSRNLETLL